MLLSNPAKIVFATCIVSLFFAGCSMWRSDEKHAVNVSLPNKKELPFATREPEVFQFEIIVRAGETERRIGVSRDGNKRRIDYDLGTEKHRAVMIADKEYRLDLKRRTYTERGLSAAGASDNDLVSHLLNARDYTDFEEVGREGSVVTFRARINESDASEVLIFFDESIGLPVRQEFYSIDGETRDLKYSVEMRNFKTDVDQGLFEIPGSFRKEGASR